MGRFRHRLAHFALFALVALMLSLLADPASADPLDNWHWRNPLPEGNAIDSVVYGNGTFVACAEGGKVLTSSDGVRWSVGGLPVSATSITFEKGTFIARGGQSVLTSPDGVTWAPPAAPVGEGVYGNGRYVTTGRVGSGWGMLTSDDGINWQPGQQLAGSSDDLHGLVFANNLFLVILRWEGGGSGVVYTSRDGLSWTASPTFEPVSIAFGNGTFVVTEQGGGVCTSKDGYTWSPGPMGQDMPLSPIFFLNNLFISFSWLGAPVTSSDGVNWTVHSSQEPAWWPSGMAYGNGTFVAVGYSGLIHTSDDGGSWTRRTTDLPIWATYVAYGNGVFVTGAQFDSRYPDTRFSLFNSTDGVTWTGQTLDPSLGIPFVGFGGDKFIAFGGNNTLFVSSDGLKWTSYAGAAPSIVWSMAYGKGLFVAIGEQDIETGPAIFTSRDGLAWTQLPVKLTDPLFKVVFGNGLFVAAGQNTIAASSDGVAWNTNAITTGLNMLLYDCVYGNGLFVVVGDSGTIMTSGRRGHLGGKDVRHVEGTQGRRMGRRLVRGCRRRTNPPDFAGRNNVEPQVLSFFPANCRLRKRYLCRCVLRRCPPVRPGLSAGPAFSFQRLRKSLEEVVEAVSLQQPPTAPISTHMSWHLGVSGTAASLTTGPALPLSVSTTDTPRPWPHS